jgi:hypothetical protein
MKDRGKEHFLLLNLITVRSFKFLNFIFLNFKLFKLVLIENFISKSTKIFYKILMTAR